MAHVGLTPHIPKAQRDSFSSVYKLHSPPPSYWPTSATSSSRKMSRNLRNAIVACLAPIPSIVFYLSFLRSYSPTSDSELSYIHSWCLNHPLLLANLLFFFNVNVLFWVIGLLQSSHWMIDVYWTVIPVMLVHYFASHPLGQYNKWRSMIVIILTWIWSIRLTRNYFRRENWEWGAREDWRFNELRKQYGKHWWWLSFFSVYVSQQVHAYYWFDELPERAFFFLSRLLTNLLLRGWFGKCGFFSFRV